MEAYMVADMVVNMEVDMVSGNKFAENARISQSRLNFTILDV